MQSMKPKQSSDTFVWGVVLFLLGGFIAFLSMNNSGSDEAEIMTLLSFLAAITGLIMLIVAVARTLSHTHYIAEYVFEQRQQAQEQQNGFAQEQQSPAGPPPAPQLPPS